MLWSFLSVQYREVGKGSLATRSHFRQSLCQRDYWWLDRLNKQCIIHQKVFSQSSFFPLFIARSFTFLSFVSLCLSVLCYAAYSLSPVCHRSFSISLSAFLLHVILFFYLTILSHRNLTTHASEPMPSCHINWKCLVHGDTLSHSYPTSLHNMMYLNMCFL